MFPVTLSNPNAVIVMLQPRHYIHRHSSHIANIINVASQRSNLILRTFVTRDIATLKSAFVTYVRPLVIYLVIYLV